MKHTDRAHDTQISHARACLEYTLQTNRNIEHRIHVVLGLNLAAVGAHGVLMQKVEDLPTVVFALVAASAFPFLVSIVYGLRALKSAVYNPDSVMLAERIAGTSREDYLAETRNQDARKILDAIAIENHALALAAITRTRYYHILRRLFFTGAAMLIAVHVYLLFLPMTPLR